MDKKVQGYAARSAENKRRMESNLRDNRGQQPPFKRQNTSGQNVARAYMAGNNERKGLGISRAAIAPVTLRRAPVGNSNQVRFFSINVMLLCYSNRLVPIESFMSTTFSALLDVAPTTYRTSHPFDSIDLYAVELGSLTSSLVWIGWHDILVPRVDSSCDTEKEKVVLTSKKAEDKSEERRLQGRYRIVRHEIALSLAQPNARVIHSVAREIF
ncbi:hypothetical protein Tco_0940567 [Tanacetum coccineum]|uniref:Uncharacterized protein n=1 Tax=Tanacetum coccineum TaxID=301880 RepID=A0ABQ5DP44_9ASTR